MDKDSRQKLHNLLVTEQLYSKPFNEFESQFSNPTSQKKLYGLLKSEQLYSKSESDFNEQFFADVSTPEKKNPIQKESTALPSTSKTTKPSSALPGQVVSGPSASFTAAPTKKKPVTQSEGTLLQPTKTQEGLDVAGRFDVLKKGWKNLDTDISTNVNRQRQLQQTQQQDLTYSANKLEQDKNKFQQKITQFESDYNADKTNPELIKKQKELQKEQEAINARLDAFKFQKDALDRSDAVVSQTIRDKNATIGELESFGNKVRGVGAQVIAMFDAIPAYASNLALDLQLASYGQTDEFNKLPAAAKQEVRNVVLGNASPAYIGSQMAYDYWNNLSEKILEKTIEQEGDLFDDVASFASKPSVENAGNVVRRATSGLAEAIPYMAQGLMPGGLVTMGITSAAGKRMEDIKEDGKAGLGYALTSGIHGTAEAFFEGKTNEILRKASARIMGNTKALGDLNTALWREILKDFNEEGLSEGFTTLFQDTQDKINKGEPIDLAKLARKIGESYVMGGVIGGGITGAGGTLKGSFNKLKGSIAGKNLLTNAVITPEDKKRLEEIRDTTQDLSTQKADDNDPVVNQVIDEKLNELEAEYRDITTKYDNVIEGLTEEQARDLFNIDDKIDEIKTRAEAIKNDPNLTDDAKKLLWQKLKQEFEPLKQQRDAIQKQTTSEVSVQPEAGGRIQMAEGESQAEPQVPTQEDKVEKIGQALDADNTFTIRGNEGNLFVDDNGLVLFESGNEIVELGNIADLSESDLKDFGIEAKDPVPIEIGEDGSIQVAGKKYVNVAEAPMDAITFDENGNVKAVRLETENGQSRFFRGKRAESIAYQYTLQNLEQNGTDEQIDTIINQATEADRTQEQTGEVADATEDAVVDEGAKQEKLYLDGEVSLLEQLLEQEETAPTQSAGISISSDTDIEDLRNKSKSRSQQATTQEEKESANTRIKIIDAAKKAIKTLKSIFPDVDIVIHDDEGSYNAAMSEVDGVAGSRGNFFIDTTPDGKTTGRIDINLSKANSRTIAHEVAHGILLKTFGDNKNLFNDFRTRLSKVIKSDVNQQLNDFANQYVDPATGELLDVNHEEFLAELTGILEQQEAEVSVTTMQKLAALINEFVSKITRGKFKPFEDIKNTKDVVDFFNNISSTIREGGEIQELNGGGEVGTFNFTSRSSLDAKEAPSVANDSRSFIRDLVEDVDMIDFNGRKFVTNMYDYTTAGTTDLGNGLTINMLGGKNYVPYMMSLQDKKIGDVSNLAAFNTKTQAESFARNAIEGDASLFAPHSGTLSESWQFQQHTFAELVNLILDKNIMSNTELIDLFNKTISSDVSKKAFNIFKSKYGKNISNFNSFKNNPKKIVELLDIKNNYSPNLRKALNNAISADKTFQKAIGVKNKEEFFKRIMDPLNDGVQGGEIINLVEFDPKTFQIVQTKPGALDHHPSFGWSILSKINGIYQPTKFYQSSNVTESYVKYNKSGEQVSRKAEESNFDKKNVSSSAGSIPKVAEFIKQSEVKSRSQLPSNDAQRIVNLARDNGFSDQAISNVLEKRGFNQGAIDIALGKSTPATKKAPSAKKILGIKPKMVTVDEMASLKSQLRLQAKAAKTAYDFAEAARKLVATYIKNNVQGALSPADQKAIFRAMEGKLDTPENKKKMIDKITGILQASEGKIAIKELDALGRMLKSMEKGSKLGAKAVADQIKSVVATIKAMGVKNQLKPAQVRLLLNGMAKNLMNATVRDKFLASAQRVLNNAQYAEDLSGARKLRATIRKTLKTGKEIVDVETSVRNFLKLDPKMVEDLDEYMEYANEIFDAIRNVQVKDGKILSKRAAVLANIDAYAAEQNAIQDEINKNYLLDEYNYLVEAGLISGDMSLDEIQSYIASIEENPESSESTKSDTIREFTKNAFEGFANTANEMLEDGELDEQDVDFDMVKRFTEMDVEALPLDQQLAAVESLENFIVNGVTSRMGAILQSYTGVSNSVNDAKAGLKARPLSYGLIGRIGYLKQITNKGLVGGILKGVASIGDAYNEIMATYISKADSLVTGVFRSTKLGMRFMKNSGFAGVVRGFVQGKIIVNEFAKKYSEKFDGSKPNGMDFKSALNIYERGIFADLSRTIKNGTPEQIKKEFNRKKKQLELTIDTLRKTGKQELIDKADLYDSIYQKIKNANSIEEVKQNIDPINQAAVKEVQDMWRKHYPEFRRMAADYYNVILEEDVDYSPDMYEKLVEEVADDLLVKGAFKMAFDVVSTEKTGTLQKNKRIEGLPKNTKTKEINRVRDYDFDFNNISALDKTLIDVKTTPSVQQFMGYTNSAAFREIFPDMDERALILKRLNFNINALRERQDTYSSKLARKLNKITTSLSKYGTRIGLGSLSSAPKQSIPMVANTMVNMIDDLGSFGMGVTDFWNDDAMAFLESSGYGISLRGAESQTSIDFAQKLVERANQGKAGYLQENLAKLGDMYIEKFLKYPDVMVANMAWLGYYRSKLKSMGVDMNTFDWKNHELNEEAADYAEFMVQDQQNMNVSELGGKLLASKDATTKIIRQLLFPFASYQFNLKDKNNRNLTLLTSKTSTNEEKVNAAKSYVAGLVESYTFQTIQGLIGGILLGAAYSVIGYDQPEEEKTEGYLDALAKAMPFLRSKSSSEKWSDSLFAGKSIFEFVTPLPLPGTLETFTLLGLNSLMDMVQGGSPKEQAKAKKELLKQQENLSGFKPRRGKKLFGEPVVDKEKAKIEERLKEPFRFPVKEEQRVSQTVGDIMGGVPSVGIEAVWDMGVRAGEAFGDSYEDKYGNVYEYSDEQKKILKTSLIPRAMVAMNIAPREFLTISNNIVKAVNQKAKEDAKAKKEKQKSGAF